VIAVSTHFCYCIGVKHAQSTRGYERAQRWVEFVALYVGMPIAVAFLLPPKAAIPALWVGGIVAWALLRSMKHGGDIPVAVQKFPSCGGVLEGQGGSLFGGRGAVATLPFVLVRFAIGAALLTGLLCWRHPEWLFIFPRTKLLLWGIVIVAYPVLSVFPQVVVYRVLFIQRYAPLFAHPYLAWVVGALVFSLAHLTFRNYVTLIFTFVGGLLFIHTYLKTRSVWLNALEHSLYGDFIFTIGWGVYFFHGGTARLIEH